MSKPENRHKVLFILGGPGSGKGTMCSHLITDYGFKHYSTGDLLRLEVKTGSELGIEIESYISKGDLVPGPIAVNLIKKNILNEDRNQVVILDGYPRNQSNIDCWNEVVGDEIKILGCVFLECSEETMQN